jgi:hypothetical protein
MLDAGQPRVEEGLIASVSGMYFDTALEESSSTSVIGMYCSQLSSCSCTVWSTVPTPKNIEVEDRGVRCPLVGQRHVPLTSLSPLPTTGTTAGFADVHAEEPIIGIAEKNGHRDHRQERAGTEPGASEPE